LNSDDPESLALIGRPDLGLTFTKLHAWRLTQYDKCVFLDADTLVLQNADELFDRPDFSAAPNIGLPDFFNSGVFVFAPSLDTYRQLVQLSVQEGSFNGGDQGLLNKFYSNWRKLDASHRLPSFYNVTAGAIYSYTAELEQHGGEIKIVDQMPWRFLKTGEQLVQWHNFFNQHMSQCLPPAYLGFFEEEWQKAHSNFEGCGPPTPTMILGFVISFALGAATGIKVFFDNGANEDATIPAIFSGMGVGLLSIASCFSVHHCLKK